MSYLGLSNIEYEIRDAQYRAAVASYDEVDVRQLIPKPDAAELANFSEIENWNLDNVLSSPIGVYFFSRHITRFANNLIIIEFYIQFNRVKALAEIPDEELEYLLNLTKILPKQYMSEIAEINEKVETILSHALFPSKGSNGLASMDEIMFNMSETELTLDLFSSLMLLINQKAECLFSAFLRSEEYQTMIETLWYAQKVPDPTDFMRFRILGKGAFGVVAGVKHKITGQLCAVKTMNKKVIKGKKAMAIINVEKTVLQLLGNTPSPFTIWLKFAFQDGDNFYMALPLCTGGDLYYHLDKNGPFGLDLTKFYVAEIFEGIFHLHSLGIIYRDLKPENVILDQSGHCRISDMGLASVMKKKKLKGRAGTPGYWAPEVLQPGVYYSYNSDYWSLGVCMFEFLIGLCPFSEAISGMPRNAATLEWKVRYPSYVYEGESTEKIAFPIEFKNFLKGMLERNPDKRFTAKQIREHDFFKGLDWDVLRCLGVTPPFVPPSNEVNASNARDLESTALTKQFASVKLEAEDEVRNFEYVSMIAYETEIVNCLVTHEDPEIEDERVMNTYFERKSKKTFNAFNTLHVEKDATDQGDAQLAAKAKCCVVM